MARCGRSRRRRSADAVGAARHAGAAAGESERVSGALRTSTAATSPLCSHAVKQVFVQESQLRKSTRPRPALPRSLHIPAVAVDATSARLLDGVEAGLRRRRGVVPVAACARPGGNVSSLAGRETRTISPRRDHEDAARRRAAASNS